jgi:hypothetical protein
MGLPWDVVPSHSPTLSDETPSIGTVGGKLGRTHALSRINAADRHNQRTNPFLDCTQRLLNDVQ